MNASWYFKKTLLISLLGHTALFGVFSFTFGNKMLPASGTPVFFWGQVLSNSDFIHSLKNKLKYDRITPKRKIGREMLAYPEKTLILDSRTYLKPNVALSSRNNKMDFTPKLYIKLSSPMRKESTIIFHPFLPYHFLLYFKDRQVVHIELEFSILSSDKRSPVVIKRKISSGNLEADLLTLRYIGRYLFIQGKRFLPNKWQTIKVDLSAPGN